MISLEFTQKEIVYLVLALKRYEAELLAQEGEDMEDSATDLIFVQTLRTRLTEVSASR